MATKSVPFQLTVTEVPVPPDFFPRIDPTAQDVPQGTPALYQVAFDAVGGFAGVVTLAVSGLPEGAVATFDKTVIGVGETAMLTIETAGVVLGTYDLALEATV